MNLLNELSRPLALDASAIPFLQAALNGAATPRSAVNGDKAFTVVGQTAIVPLAGVMLRNCDEFFQELGFCSCADVGDMLEVVAKDTAIKRTLIVVDSPGGAVSGTVELANLVMELNRRKPIDAFISGQGCSAAYWAVSGGRQISAAPSATVGSVGVLSVHVDQTAAQEAAGYRIEIFRSGPLKAVGALGEKLSTEQRQHIESSVQEAFGLFKGHLAANRPRLSPAVFSGQTYMGLKAESVGLIDSVVPSLAAMLSGYLSETAIADFQTLVKQGMRTGKSKAESIVLAARLHPEAHQEYVRSGGGAL